MKISLLTANLSSNALGRTYMLAKILQRRYEVEILGPIFGKGIWPPCDTGEFAYKAVKGCHFPRFFFSVKSLLEQIEGDVIYAIKPRLTSLGVGLLANKLRKLPLVLDIDDWDNEGLYASSYWRRVLGVIKAFYDPYANQYLRLMEHFIPQADAVTTVSSLLQQQFGGIFVPHGRDTDYLNPVCYSGEKLRQKWGLDNRKIVMFLGSPKPHKGLEDIISAIHLQVDVPLTLVIVGANLEQPYSRQLKELGKEKVLLLGMQPFAEIPHFLAAADIIALPQWDIPFARAQLPAKVFDAMAMAKPIVATDVGDLPQILGDSGLIVPPGNITALGTAIRQLATDSQLAQNLGRQARQRCIDNYSWDVLEGTLTEIFEKLV